MVNMPCLRGFCCGSITVVLRCSPQGAQAQRQILKYEQVVVQEGRPGNKHAETGLAW